MRVRANGVTFCVEERGSGEPLVLLHGFTGSSASWFPVMADLARDCRVVAIDLIGHGCSEAPDESSRYAFDLALDDLDEIAARLCIGHAPWFGYSMGARLALGLSLKHPLRVSALILESGTPGIADVNARMQRKASDETLARRIEEDGIEAFVAEWERLPMWESQLALPPGIRQRQHDHRLRNRPIGLANSLRGMGQGAQPSLWHRLAEIRTPVLLIAGALDPKFAGIAIQLQATIPESELRIVPNAGHAIHLEDPRQFAEDIREFLARRGNLATATRQESTR